MFLTSVGLAAGLLCSLMGSRALRPVLFGVSPTDGVTYLSVSAVLGVTCIIACLIPATGRPGRIPRSSPGRNDVQNGCRPSVTVWKNRSSPRTPPAGRRVESGNRLTARVPLSSPAPLPRQQAVVQLWTFMSEQPGHFGTTDAISVLPPERIPFRTLRAEALSRTVRIAPVGFHRPIFRCQRLSQIAGIVRAQVRETLRGIPDRFPVQAETSLFERPTHHRYAIRIPARELVKTADAEQQVLETVTGEILQDRSSGHRSLSEQCVVRRDPVVAFGFRSRSGLPPVGPPEKTSRVSGSASRGIHRCTNVSDIERRLAALEVQQVPGRIGGEVLVADDDGVSGDDDGVARHANSCRPGYPRRSYSSQHYRWILVQDAAAAFAGKHFVAGSQVLKVLRDEAGCSTACTGNPGLQPEAGRAISCFLFVQLKHGGRQMDN